METLEEAREWLREHVKDGAECPCCTQFAKVYRRKIYSRMARLLILAWREAETHWFYLPTTLKDNSGDFAKLRYWGLVEEQDGEREDGSKHVGWWRITEKGEAYVKGELAVPKYARIYNGRCLGLVVDETADIRDALGKHFSYSDLMAGV